MKSAPYRAGEKAREFEKIEIVKMLHMNVIEPAQLHWAWQIVFVSKKDGSLNFSIEYRKLYAVTAKYACTIRRSDECLNSLGKLHQLSMLDLKSYYCQIAIDDGDKKKRRLHGTMNCSNFYECYQV